MEHNAMMNKAGTASATQMPPKVPNDKNNGKIGGFFMPSFLMFLQIWT